VKDARRLNPNEPVLAPADASFDVVPADLATDAEAVAEWDRIVPTLRKVGLVSDLERAALVTVCRCWSRLVAAEREIQASGAVLQGEAGPVVNPSVKVANDAIGQCLKLWAELGMTPAGRSKLSSLVKRDTPAVSKWAGVV
jgi:P27 family predicted phage terminase small subunit